MGNRVLTEAQVIEIRELYVMGKHTQTELSELYGIGASGISAVILHKTWADAGGPAPPKHYEQRGEHANSAKLNNAKVRSIRRKRENGASATALAREHGVSVGAIMNVIRRGTWAHLP